MRTTSKRAQPCDTLLYFWARKVRRVPQDAAPLAAVYASTWCWCADAAVVDPSRSDRGRGWTVRLRWRCAGRRIHRQPIVSRRLKSDRGSMDASADIEPEVRVHHVVFLPGQLGLSAGAPSLRRRSVGRSATLPRNQHACCDELRLHDATELVR